MDLRAESQRLRLDVLAVRVCATLEAAGIPCVLLKGPTTSTWLYDPPRIYNDVDVLVPPARAHDALRVLAVEGVATAATPVTTEAQDNWLLHSAEGFEVDVHLSLPAVDHPGDEVWRVLNPHVVRFDLGVGSVPALDVPARCLVLALHALNSDLDPERPAADLRLGLERAGAADWAEARALSARLGVEDLLDAGLSLVGVAPGTRSSVRARLFLDRAPSSAFVLERALRRGPAGLARAVVPPRTAMLAADPRTSSQPLGVLRAHLRRWRRIARGFPATIRAIRAARRNRQ